MMQLRMQANPVQRWFAGNNFNLDSGFLQQRGGLESALPSTYHGNPPALKLAKVAVLAGVRGQTRRNSRELRRPGDKRGDACGNHDSASRKFLAVSHRDFETATSAINGEHLALLQILYRLLLIPASVVYKSVERNGLRKMIAFFTAVGVEGQPLTGICDVRSAPVRAQAHADGHLLFPERHGFAEDSGFDSCGAQVRRGGEAIRASAENQDIAIRGFLFHSNLEAFLLAW